MKADLSEVNFIEVDEEKGLGKIVYDDVLLLVATALGSGLNSSFVLLMQSGITSQATPPITYILPLTTLDVSPARPVNIPFVWGVLQWLVKGSNT